MYGVSDGEATGLKPKTGQKCIGFDDSLESWRYRMSFGSLDGSLAVSEKGSVA
jgi:hypothetical protein